MNVCALHGKNTLYLKEGVKRREERFINDGIVHFPWRKSDEL